MDQFYQSQYMSSRYASSKQPLAIPSVRDIAPSWRGNNAPLCDHYRELLKLRRRPIVAPISDKLRTWLHAAYYYSHRDWPGWIWVVGITRVPTGREIA